MLEKRFPFEVPDEETASAPLASPIQLLEEKFERSLPHPKVSIIIVNHNGADALWNCLFALKTQTYAPFEIILVDNASRDASVSFTRANYPHVKIFECEENFGPAMAANLGVKTAKGDLVALVPPEVVVTPDWLGRMVEDFKKSWPLRGVVMTAVRPDPGGLSTLNQSHQTLNILGNPVAGFFEDSLAVFYPGGGPVLFPRFFSLEGPFDGDYFSNQEDVYLGWNFLLLNHPMTRSKGARAFQNSSTQASDLPEWKTVYFQTRNRWLNLLVFYERGSLLKILPLAAVDAALQLIKSLGIGFGYFWGTFFAMAWVCLHPALIYKKRRMIQEKRKVADAGVLRFISGRLARDGGVFSRLLNLFSLAYCRLMNLPVLESQE